MLACFDTAENELCKVCPLCAYRSPRYNFDAPDSIAFDECCESVRELRHWKDVEIPQYDFSSHARSAETTLVKSREIIMVEGILIFNDERLRSMMDLKIFVDCDQSGTSYRGWMVHVYISNF